MTGDGTVTDGGRWELLRAIGAVADSPAAARAVGPALGLGPVSDADHTEVFVLNCPPYAGIYLGPDGALGGEGTDRVAGFWRAIGVTPPAEPDHLTALLGLYACLGEAADGTRRDVTAAALRRSRAALLAEHLWPWLPCYLDAVADGPVAKLAAWATLANHALACERSAAHSPGKAPAERLPLALRAAPGGLNQDAGLKDLVGALVTPVRSGMILTRHRLAAGAEQIGVGHRIGERRFALWAVLEQDPPAALAWLAGEAHRWELRHAARGADAACRWWTARAARTRQALEDCAAAAAVAVEPAGAR
ncbi:MAG: molecular chaperone TorD family protein [Streptosporangiaceae bacterium]